MQRDEKILTPTEARQASSRRLNLRVLVNSLILAVVLAAILYIVIYATDSPISVPDEERVPAAPTAQPLQKKD